MPYRITDKVIDFEKNLFDNAVFSESFKHTIATKIEEISSEAYQQGQCDTFHSEKEDE